MFYINKTGNFIKKFFNNKIKKYTTKRYYCPICDKMTVFEDMINEVETRKSSKCSECNSLERHRYLYFLYKFLFLDSVKKIKILHFAPELSFYNLISKNQNIEYYTMDIDPSNYGFANNMVEGSILNIPFEDNFFDFVIYNQVLEHVTEEEKCLEESLRVLKEGGICIINIPYSNNNQNNFESDSIKTSIDRKKEYYQSDHVRLYGRECLDKYITKYNLYRIDNNIFPTDVVNKMKLIRKSDFLDDAYYILKK